MAELDHIIIAGPELEALVDEFHAVTGVRAVPGGRHEGLGTANHLVGLGDGSYIELIGPDPNQPEPANPRPLRVDEVTRTTVVGWAVRVKGIDERVEAARKSGYDPGDPAPMSRTTPAGESLNWVLTPPAGGFDGTVPFLIDWQDTPHPSHGLPHLDLVRFNIEHPRVTDVRIAIRAVGAGHLVGEVTRSATPRIRLDLVTPNGPLNFG